MIDLWPWIALAGLAVLVGRLIWPVRHPAQRRSGVDADEQPVVSIIVAARNEAETIVPLIESLLVLDYQTTEVIVVDDRSDDATAELARGYADHVIVGTDLPDGWCGKQWALHQGMQRAVGDLLLFTDADTSHPEHSLATAVDYLQRKGLDMVSAVPHHTGGPWWGRLLGVFYSLLFVAAAPFSPPRRGRVYAIGQYLLMRRSAWERLGGHAAVRADVAEDIALARRAIQLGLRYAVLPWYQHYQVNLYPTWEAFWSGWLRNFREGLRQTDLRATIEVGLVVATSIYGLSALWNPEPSRLLTAVGSLAIFGWTSRRLGQFSLAALPIAVPLGLAAFIGVSMHAVIARALGQGVVWRGRVYGARSIVMRDNGETL